MNTKELLKDLPVFEIQQGIDNYQAALEVQKRVNNFELMLQALKEAKKALLNHFDDDNDNSIEANTSNLIIKAIKQAEGEA